MLLTPASRHDFDFQRDVRVDVGNEGFTPEEIRTLAGPAEAVEGERGGVSDWWKSVWRAGRQPPPELRDLKSELGYQSQPFLTDLIAVAEAQGTPLDGIIKAKAPKYNFYIMRCGVFVAPDGDEKFEALKFEVRFKSDAVSTFSMLPGPQTQKILELGGNVDIGVNSKVEFGFPEVPLGPAKVEANAKAAVDAKFIVSFAYELKSPVVDSFGIGTSFCRWLMHKGDKLRNDVVFYPVIMTPKTVTTFDCEFRAFFKINHHAWKHAEFFRKPPVTLTVSA